MISLALLLAACSGDKVADTAAANSTPTGRAGHASHTLSDGLVVEVWFPTDDAPSPAPLPDAFLDGEQASAYAALLDKAPTGCPTTTTDAALGADIAEGIWPVVVMSHCHNCIRFSNMTIAEALAQNGYVVVAPDHAGNTVFDRLADETLPLDADTLQLRRVQLGAALDSLLDGALGISPEQLDEATIGALGHSFGSVSVGLLAQEDDRIGAAMGIAAPMENPLLPGVSIEALEVPLMFVVAEEDNSITEAGNILIRSNFDAAPSPAWKVEIADAGHWSLSDICGLLDDFMPGCGTDARQTDPDETVTYPDPAASRALGAELAVAFFAEALRGEAGAIAAAAAGVDLSTR